MQKFGKYDKYDNLLEKYCDLHVWKEDKRTLFAISMEYDNSDNLIKAYEGPVVFSNGFYNWDGVITVHFYSGLKMDTAEKLQYENGILTDGKKQPPCD